MRDGWVARRRSRTALLLVIAGLLVAGLGVPAWNGSGASAVTQEPSPSIQLEPRWAQIGGAVTVTGEGFFPSSECGQVVVVFDFGGEHEQEVAVVSLPDTPDGRPGFETTFTAPDVPVGEYLVVADQTRSGCNAIDREPVDLFRFSVDPDRGPAASTATASGAGFPDAAECGPVIIRFDGEQVAEVATTGFPGDPFSQGFTVPERPAATYVVEASQGGCGTLRGTDTFTIPSPRPDPTLALDPAEGPIGSETEAVATGFDPDDAVTVLFGDVEVALVPGDDVAAEAGGFTALVTVPPGVPGGEVTVTACQRCDTEDERAATATFTVTPRLEVEPELGPPGLVVQARGDGFPASTLIRLSWLPGIGITAATTDDVGVLDSQVLVLHRDVLGPRELVAALAAEPDAVVATDTYLVVHGTMQPPSFATRR